MLEHGCLIVGDEGKQVGDPMAAAEFGFPRGAFLERRTGLSVSVERHEGAGEV